MAEAGSDNILFHAGEVTAGDRAKVLNQRGCTIWLTGLSGSGKSTVAVALERKLLELGHAAYRLDGDNVRLGLNAGLGFSREDREENIRRVSEVAKLFADSGLICVVCFISPYRADRERARQIHEAAGLPFFEVFIDCPLEEAERRDPKGLYKKARAGEIKSFTGISDPYEAPAEPSLRLPTAELTIAEEVDRAVTFLKDQRITDLNHGR